MAQGESGARTSRSRVWIGLLAVTLGCYLAGDVEQRARTAVGFGVRWWPWGLLVLAVVSLLRSALPTGSLVGPLFLISVAVIGLARSDGAGSRVLMNLALPGLLALGGAAIVLDVSAARRKPSWSRVLTSGRVVLPEEVRGTVTVRAVLGELRADLTRAPRDQESILHVTAIAGHVRVAVPRDRWIRVHTSGTVLTRVADTGPKPTEPPDASTGLTIHVLGICGVVGIVRV